MFYLVAKGFDLQPHIIAFVIQHPILVTRDSSLGHYLLESCKTERPTGY